MKHRQLYIAGIFILFQNILIAQSLDRYRSDFYILYDPEFVLTTSEFENVYENKDIVILQRKEDVQSQKFRGFALFVEDTVNVFYFNFEDQDGRFENLFFIYNHHAWCRFELQINELTNGLPVIAAHPLGNVWRTKEGYYYIKYLEMNKPNEYYTVDFAFKYKNDDGWWDWTRE